MRKIKFRGKRIDNGEWVYGSLLAKLFRDYKTEEEYYLLFNEDWDLEGQINYLKNPKNFSHCSDSVCKVRPETVGQFTGKKDRNGKEIFEGDKT